MFFLSPSPLPPVPLPQLTPFYLPLSIFWLRLRRLGHGSHLKGRAWHQPALLCKALARLLNRLSPSDDAGPRGYLRLWDSWLSDFVSPLFSGVQRAKNKAIEPNQWLVLTLDHTVKIYIYNIDEPAFHVGLALQSAEEDENG